MRQTASVTIEKVWLSNKEAQKYLGVGVEFFKLLRTTGRLPFYRVGRTVFYRKSDIDYLVESGKNK